MSRDAILLALGTGNISTWIKNPVMYELGSTTTRLFPQIQHLSAIARGEWIWARYGWSGWVLGGGSLGSFGTTIWTGLTPGASFAGVAACHATEAVLDWWWDWLGYGP